MIDTERFVKSLLACMWMLNDLPRNMRKDLNAQLGLIWLLLCEPHCFPCLTFTEAEQRAICDELAANSSEADDAANFKFTYDALLMYEGRKVQKTQDDQEPSGTAPAATDAV